VSDSLKPHGLLPTRLLYPWGFPGKNTCHFLLQIYDCLWIKPKKIIIEFRKLSREAWHVAVHGVAELGTTEKALTQKLYSYSCTPEETLPSVHQRAHPRMFIHVCLCKLSNVWIE